MLASVGSGVVFRDRSRRAPRRHDSIDEYLFELRHRLRVPSDRPVAAIESRLRESAAVCGEADAIARLGSPEAVARRLHQAARERATRLALRALCVAGVVLLLGYLVDVFQPRAMWRGKPMPLVLQWKLTFAGMFGLSAIAFGVAAMWRRVREDRPMATRYALASVATAGPAVLLHLAYQVDRLGRVDHEPWFRNAVLASAGIRMAVLAAAFVMIAAAARTIRASS